MKRFRFVSFLVGMICIVCLIVSANALEGQECPAYQSMLESGVKIAELQNTYMTIYSDRQAYDVVYNTLKQYIPDGLQCRVWYGNFQWEFATKYVRPMLEQKVLWFGRDDAGDIKAFCTGIYNYETRTYSDIVWSYYGEMGWLYEDD